VNIESSINGNWWIYGQNAPPHYGVLSLRDDGLTLEVNESRSLSVEEVFRRALTPEDPPAEGIIHGRGERCGPITLFGCWPVRNYSTERIHHVISPLAGVSGLEVKSWREPIARSICLNFEYLNRWFAHKVLEPIQTSDGIPGWAIPHFEDSIFPVHEGLTVRFVRQTLPSSSLDERRFTPSCNVYLSFAQPVSLEDVTGRWIPWITRFFSLLIGTKIECLSTEISATDGFTPPQDIPQEWGKILRRTSKPKRTHLHDPSPATMLVPFATVQNRLQAMLERWHDINQRMQPVVDLFSAVVLQHSIYVQAQFLFLSQALEVYHSSSLHFESKKLSKADHAQRVDQIVAIAPEQLKEWAERELRSRNSKYFNDRLLEVFQANEREAKLLLGDIRGMADRIAYTRNHFTHYHGDTKSDRFLTETEMYRVNYSIEVFLWILLLKELDIQGPPIERLLYRVKGATFVNLKEVVKGS
jgi:hypothetical protein